MYDEIFISLLKFLLSTIGLRLQMTFLFLDP